MKANAAGERFFAVMRSDEKANTYSQIGTAKKIAKELAEENPGEEYVVLIADISFKSNHMLVKQLR